MQQPSWSSSQTNQSFERFHEFLKLVSFWLHFHVYSQIQVIGLHSLESQIKNYNLYLQNKLWQVTWLLFSEPLTRNEVDRDFNLVACYIWFIFLFGGSNLLFSMHMNCSQHKTTGKDHVLSSSRSDKPN